MRSALRFSSLAPLLWALTSCASQPPPELLPPSLAGWQRSVAAEMSPQSPPEPVSRVERFVQASYQGTVPLVVRVYQVPASAIGLDFVQRWQAPGNVDYFYEGKFVAIVEWRPAGREAQNSEPDPQNAGRESQAGERPDLAAFTSALRAHLRTL